MGGVDAAKSVSALVQRGQGAPAREPLVTDQQQKQMMLQHYRRQEELKVRGEGAEARVQSAP